MRVAATGPTEFLRCLIVPCLTSPFAGVSLDSRPQNKSISLCPKRTKRNLRKKDRKALLKSASNTRKTVKVAKKASVKATAVRNGHSAAKVKKGRLVYFFGDGRSDGDGKMKALLGGKGANLAEMTRIGLPVPPGFTITTEVCTWFNQHGKALPKEIDGQIGGAISRIETILGKGFGSVGNPLLFAVRSGSRDSMPGMMDTILNLGLNDETVLGLVAASANERFAYDCYRRFIQMYGDVVMGVQTRPGEHHEPFETVISGLKAEVFPGRANVSDTELDASSLKELVVRFKKLVRDRTGQDFPSDPQEQLRGAIGAVFGSWNNDRAIVYRQKYNIPNEWGTAVNVQAMVFGNTGDESCSGVAFTRDPATGEKVFYGEYLINAQGEDVVAGVRTPDPVATLQEKMPRAYRELEDVRAALEKHFREMQDFEFTVENGKLFMLQTRNGKRTGVAAVRIAVEMVKEKLITWQEAVARVPADQLSQLLTPIFDRQAIKHAEKIASGLPAGPGAASGRIYFNANEAEAESAKGKVLLGARGDLAGRYPRHARGRGHPHRARRSQLPRRAGGAPDGQGLRLRRQRAAYRLS